MYDGEGQPGRNDECWCGSGKKYKKCHWQTDERLQELYDKGYEVPTRDILKGPADIEAIKASAAINVGVLDMVAERIAPGVSTEEIDQWIYDYTIEHGGPGIRRFPEKRVHVHQRRYLPRHSLQRGRAERGRYRQY